MRSAQRCLDAKSFLHYANDAYTPYEILHVIGFGQDHFLPSNEKGGEREREGSRQKENRGRNWKRSTGDEGGTQQSAFIFLCFRENMFLIFEAPEERPEKGDRLPKGMKSRRGQRGSNKNEERRQESYTEEPRAKHFFLKKTYFSFAR